MSREIAALRQAMVGRVYGKEIVSIERAPVSNFATAVREQHDVFFNSRTAKAAGFADIPVPPTYPFAMFHWGNFAELRAAHWIDPVPPNPLGDVMDHRRLRGARHHVAVHGCAQTAEYRARA